MGGDKKWNEYKCEKCGKLVIANREPAFAKLNCIEQPCLLSDAKMLPTDRTFDSQDDWRMTLDDEEGK